MDKINTSSNIQISFPHPTKFYAQLFLPSSPCRGGFRLSSLSLCLPSNPTSLSILSNDPITRTIFLDTISLTQLL